MKGWTQGMSLESQNVILGFDQILVVFWSGWVGYCCSLSRQHF